MARQCWDEARHVEISVKLADWMGSEIGQYAENTVLFEAACSHDPVLRLAGVNRALEGLAIDVFTTMKEFGDAAGDPFLEFCEDWMLADEVTHVKMGSDWLRRVTEGDPERRAKALEFQGVVDKLFSYGGTRSESDESPIGLARRFRELAGFTDDEIDDIAEVSLAALGERKRQAARLQSEAAAAFSSAASAADSAAASRAERARQTAPPPLERSDAADSAAVQHGPTVPPSGESAGVAGGRMTSVEPMAVTVSPEQFTMVLFDANAIKSCAESLLTRLDMEDHSLHIEVDETTPIARVQSEIGDPIVVRAESGAFEDTRRPRQLSETAVNTALGRTLLRVRDRLSGRFDAAPADGELDLAQVAAWDTYSVGRLARLGYPVHQPRWIYNFRNRHGFTDQADESFAEIWSADGLSWEELSALSDRAANATTSV